MKLFGCNIVHCLGSVVFTALILFVFSATSRASDIRYLWQSRDQFVALERQGSTGVNGTTISNDHPVEITPDRLTAILASIEYNSQDRDSPEQLLTNQSLEVLVPQLVQGFRQAGRSDDVIFAVIGLRNALFGIAKNPKVTTGRLFYKEGRLNIIFGLVQNDFNEREDRRLSPFTPGNRQKVMGGDWSLITKPGQTGSSQIRKDWITFSDEWHAPAVQSPVEIPSAQQKQAAPIQPVKHVNDERSPAERLTNLKELKEKGLITEEEYSNKRREILNGL